MLLLFASLLMATAFAETCISKDEIEWQSYGHQLYLNGERFNMKGLSWFGFETGLDKLYGLDYHDRDWYFQWMVDRGFNAIRMPFASDFLNNDNGWDDYIEAVMAAGDYGLFIMLDMHSKTEGAWTDGLYTIDQDDEIETWRTLASKLVAAGAWNVLFVDVFNEPHDVTNDQWADWLEFCQKVAEAVWDEGLDALIAVEGTNWDCQSSISCSWGENLIGPKNKGVTFDASKSNKFVWSPHVYGGDVRGDYSYSESEWESHWAYLQDTDDYGEAAIVIGEFGTTYTGSMVDWLDDLVDYLVSIDQKNHFFWCLNPNSGDTGGLLQDDWTTEESGKLAALAKLQANPSTVTVSTKEICVDGLGESAVAPSADTDSADVSSVDSDSEDDTSSSSGSTIKILENANSNVWWMAIEFPNGDNSAITKLEMQDSNHNSWVSGEYQKWGTGAYSFSDGTQFNGAQHFRVTTSSGTATTYNAFSSLSGGSTSELNLPGSSFTEEEDTASSAGSQVGGLIAGLIGALLCIFIPLCIGTWWYKNKYRLNKGEASFETTNPETPEPSKGDTPISDEMPQQTADPQDAEDAEAEIEIEMEVEQTATRQ